MKRVLDTVWAAICGASLLGQARPALAQRQWMQAPPMPTARSSHAAAVVGDSALPQSWSLFAIGGRDAQGNVLGTVEAFNLTQNVWTPRMPMPTARALGGSNAAVVGNIIYVAGGDTGGMCTNQVESYDTDNDVWNIEFPMPTPRCGLTLVALGGLLYAIGGSFDSAGMQPLGMVEVYDPAAGIWSFAPPLPEPRSQMAAAVMDGRIYIAGGLGGGMQPSQSFDVFDPNGQPPWTRLQFMPTPRSQAASAVAKDGLYVIGGLGRNGAQLSVVETYDPLNRAWVTGTALPSAYGAIAAVSAEGIVFAGGGSNAGVVSSSWYTFSPTWSCPTNPGDCPPGYMYLTGASWQLCYNTDVPDAGGGTRIYHACFQNRTVLYEATQPFAIVPYHGMPPSPTYKDGVSPRCGGVVYSPIGPAMAGLGPDDDNPMYMKVQIAKNYQLGWYIYRQRWTFRGTGEMEFSLGLGGDLAPFSDRAHIHGAYWKLDLDIDQPSPNYAEEFNHPGLTTPNIAGSIFTAGPRIGTPGNFTNWRIRSNLRNMPGNQFHSYELSTRLGQTDDFTTADVWLTRQNLSGNGAVVGASGAPGHCDDTELSTVYSPASANINGKDIVVWVSARHHHETRYQGEESPHMPGFEYVTIELLPRNFTNSTPF